MKKKLKIVLLAVAGLVILYHLMFVEVRLYDSKFNHLGEPDKMSSGYGDYFLFRVSKIDWGNSVFIPHRRIQFYPIYEKYAKAKIVFAEHAVLFRWNYYKLRQRIKSELLEEMSKLDQFEDIEYEYDEEKMQLNIKKNVGWSKVRSDIFYNIQDKFDLLSRLYPNVGGICKEKADEGDEKFGMLKGQLEADYDKEELDLLNKLLINKLPEGNSEGRFDLKDTSQIRWTETEGTLNISWLDLRKYSQISGVMDLSKFKKMEYVSLEGLNFLMLQLPPALKCLDEHSVSHCKKIVRLELPETLEYLEGAVFEGCSGLKEVVFKGDAPEVRGDKSLFEGIENKVKILYDKTKKGWTDKYWEQYELVPMKSNDVHIEKGQTQEKTYNSNDLHHLEEIFSRTKCPQPISFEHSDYVTWELVDGVYMVIGLDLSKCNDIMGTLDLSVFSHLECTKLKQMRIQEVILPDSFKAVGKSTFERCQFLKRVVFTGEIKHIFIEGFSGCANLEEVIFKGKAPQIIGDRPLFWESKNKVTIYYEKNKKGWTGDYWKKYNMQGNE